MKRLALKKYLTLLLVLLTSSSILAHCNKSIYTCPLNTANQHAFKHVQQQLAAATKVSGNFTQTHHIALLSAPLKSSGYFTLTHGKSLQWLQTQPFKSSLLVTKSKLVQKIENNPATVLTKTQQPIVFAFTKIFLSIFNGNAQVLKHYFTIYFRGDKQQWQIGLVPIHSPLNKAITNVTLSGGKTIQRVNIKEAQKNQLLIQFSHVKILHSPPSSSAKAEDLGVIFNITSINQSLAQPSIGVPSSLDSRLRGNDDLVSHE